MTYKIPLELIETTEGGCHLLVKVLFNKTATGWLILDTGANKTVFDKKRLAEHASFGEMISEEISSGINASIGDSQHVIINQIAMHKFTLKHIASVVIDLDYLNELYRNISDKEIWGLLGGDFLQKYKATIHYEDQCLFLVK